MEKLKPQTRETYAQAQAAQAEVRPEIMAHVRTSIEKNRKLLELLARGARPG